MSFPVDAVICELVDRKIFVHDVNRSHTIRTRPKEAVIGFEVVEEVSPLIDEADNDVDPEALYANVMNALAPNVRSAPQSADVLHETSDKDVLDAMVSTRAAWGAVYVDDVAEKALDPRMSPALDGEKMTTWNLKEDTPPYHVGRRDATVPYDHRRAMLSEAGYDIGNGAVELIVTEVGFGRSRVGSRIVNVRAVAVAARLVEEDWGLRFLQLGLDQATLNGTFTDPKVCCDSGDIGNLEGVAKVVWIDFEARTATGGCNSRVVQMLEFIVEGVRHLLKVDAKSVELMRGYNVDILQETSHRTGP
ncbi:hypothetical protein EXIGLDRAFT_698983 [Exidia glandulosa HHB12029]|uniref:Uncharacterized protein n=1 Tax=Exidia glandulosa HHB12029 TaxID=1314781 RepID=A0A165E0F9_EXIGL|nr:hypothetical protein EXIGLDRAFT_698983 [Exidia glandulosa HHB12029]